MGKLQDGIVALRNLVQERMVAVDTEKTAVQSELDQIATVEADGVAELQAKYDAGFEDALKQAGQAGGSDKLYSDEELNAEIALRTGPLNDQINSLTNEVASLTGSNAALQSQVDGIQAQIDGAVVAAVSAVKADMLAKYEAQQVAETDSETGFINYLKS